MNILLTNDDGYTALGIKELSSALGISNNIFLVAPKKNCSGMSAAISLHQEIAVEEIAKNIYAVSGTPADCSYLGLLSIISEPIDMIVSGINLGANLGEDVFYSGTVGAAIAGRRLTYVPVAFSVAAYHPKNIKFIAQKASEITQQVTNLPADQNLLVNVNFPDIPASEVQGIKITSLGKRGVPDSPKLVRKNKSSALYSFGASGGLIPNQKNTDIQAVNNNFISISILDYNLTATDSNLGLFEEVFVNA
ncbi:5'/3'-nucleotidase SurE [Gammaproteobacteria bacterium]|nr:5'/3'-nucleotidase SurE [Gammaproteobacteria bacterium]